MTTAIVILALHRTLQPAFRADTSYTGILGTPPSTGQCAAAALVVHALLGGELVSAVVDGQSHWFNRIDVECAIVDVDFTSDQFGMHAPLVAPPGKLHEGTRLRSLSEANVETLQRARLLAERAGLTVTL